MNDDDVDLMDQLRRLAASGPREAGPKVEGKLVEAFRARHRRRRPLLIYAAIAAVFVLIAFAVGFKLQHPRPVFAESVYNVPGFVALPYAESGVPMESAIVIRVQMRPAQLAAMGLALPAQPMTAKFKADLLVGQDGVPRAVRLVQ